LRYSKWVCFVENVEQPGPLVRDLILGTLLYINSVALGYVVEPSSRISNVWSHKTIFFNLDPTREKDGELSEDLSGINQIKELSDQSSRWKKNLLAPNHLVRRQSYE